MTTKTRLTGPGCLLVLSLNAAAWPGSEHPLAHWGLDEGKGTIAGDASGNGSDGAIHGAEWAKGAGLRRRHARTGVSHLLPWPDVHRPLPAAPGGTSHFEGVLDEVTLVNTAVSGRMAFRPQRDSSP